jgi:hypothetical protein
MVIAVPGGIRGVLRRCLRRQRSRVGPSSCGRRHPRKGSTCVCRHRRSAGPCVYRIGALVILGGECLLNDETALLIYRGAVLAAAGTWTGLSALPVALGAVLCSVVVGIASGAAVPRLLRCIAGLPTGVISQFASTFAVGILADKLTLSPVITLVCYAITLVRIGRARLDRTHRPPSCVVREVSRHSR